MPNTAAGNVFDGAKLQKLRNTEEVTVTETCTRETRRQVTEYTETREITEIGERLHGVEVKEAHTHT